MILLGNTYPLSLIRRPVSIVPTSLDELRRRAQSEGILSFWGHSNTTKVAAEFLGFDPTPHTQRPAITLSQEMLPSLDGQTFNEVWVLSPDYIPGYRPQIGEEVSVNQIAGWQVLRIGFSINP